MKKLLILSFVVFNSIMFSQNIYFSEPTSSHIDYSTSEGWAPIAYDMYSANGWVISWYKARLTYPDGSQSDWMQGETGGWWVTKAGTYQIEGKAYGTYVAGYSATLTRSAFSFSVVDNCAPASPQSLASSSNSGDYKVLLSWTANSEYDLDSYEISRRVSTENITGSWSVIATTTSNSYVDTDYMYGGDVFTLDYRVRAKDINGNYSSYTSITTGGWPSGKIILADNCQRISIAEESFTESLSNYPNPFNPSTKISFSIPSNGHVSLKIYDMLGREVAVLANKVLEAGQYEYNFNGENLASGTYIYCLRTNNKTITKKMLLIK